MFECVKRIDVGQWPWTSHSVCPGLSALCAITKYVIYSVRVISDTRMNQNVCVYDR